MCITKLSSYCNAVNRRDQWLTSWGVAWLGGHRVDGWMGWLIAGLPEDVFYLHVNEKTIYITINMLIWCYFRPVNPTTCQPGDQSTCWTINPSSFLPRKPAIWQPINLSTSVLTAGAEWMDCLWFYILFNSISVISGLWKGEHEGLCAMKCCLGWERILLPVGFKPETPWSEIWSANRLALRMLQVRDGWALL